MDAEKVFYENVVQLVTKLGIPLSMCGHKYLCDSVVLSQRDRNLLYSINKGLYNEVAKLNNVSVESVEKCIRTAIAKAWEENPDVFQEKMYGFAGDSIKGKPGVVEIIAMINWTLVTQGRNL